MAAAFPTTRWSIVLRAKPSDPASGKALHELCETYWGPLYVFLRRQGHDKEDAEDIVQGFMARLMGGSGIGGAEPDRGRFRSYLLGALKHYKANERAKQTALKRGGGHTVVSFDFESGESRVETAADRSPEEAYAYTWALEVLDRARERLEDSYRTDGRGEVYEALEPFLLGTDPPRYEQVARDLGTSEASARVAVHRLRTRFGKHLRALVAETVGDEGDVDDELRAVIAATMASA